MSVAGAKKFETERYRQQVMLNEILVQSRRVARPDVEAHANRILDSLSKLDWTKSASTAQGALRKHSEEIKLMSASVEMVFSHEKNHPQWLRFLAIGLPSFSLLFFGFLIIERRRRLKALSKSDVESFEATDEKT